MKRKNKFNIAVLLKTVVVLLVLSAMLLSAMLGVTKAEYFKTLSKKLDLELMPDLALEYYLYDANPKGSTSGNNESTTYHVKTGVYKNSKSILQPIAVGHKDPKTNEDYWGKYNNKPIKYLFGDSIIYQIKIPVDESGYYTLDFTVDFLFGGSQNPYEAGLNTHGIETTTGHYKQSYDHPENDYFEDGVFTQTYQYCMGCEVLNSDDNFVFGSDFNMANRISQTNTQKNNADERVYYADKGTHSVYQWKTLTPTRAETVKLSFKATDADVTKGYVIWAWDMTGIKGGHNYRISITGLEINKTMNLDGTTKYRSNVDPYFMFPQTSFTNNQVYYNENQNSNPNKVKPYYRGSNVPGKTGYSQGRGTFITEATENSLGLRAESLYRSVTELESGKSIFTNRTDANQSNPVALQIPVKNIKYDTTYKVTFDFSIARQGNTEVANITTNNTNYTELFAGVNDNTNSSTLGKNLYDYAAFEEIFPSLTSDTQFRSYLYATSTPDAHEGGFGITNENHEKRRHQIVYANKIWNNATLDTAQGQSGDFSLTCYNPVTRYNMAQNTNLLKFPNYTTIDEKGTVNDPFCTVVQDWTSDDGKLDMTGTTCRNWFNAVQHIEQNGQQGINWITFYNTTFSFNIGEKDNIAKLGAANSDGFINNLYWIWQIDALEHMGWYNIRIDNVRIQEVVQYSSEIEKNGVKIADTSIGVDHMKYFADGKSVETDNVFSNYRGWNGTGQNVNPRGYDKGNFFAVGNIYAPVIDARKFSVAPGQGTGAKDYKIELDGWAVCEGGIRKYVYSADGGKTWHDMTFTGTNVMASKSFKDVNNNIVTVSGWTYAEYGVEQKLNQQSIYNGANSNFVEFDASDGANCNFDGFKLCADLTPYKNQPDLDIIIAAVPCSNINARCEILRIMNYHSSNYYASQIESISSDIVSSAGNIAIPQEELAITSATNGNGQAGNWFTDGGKFYYNENNWHVDYYPTSSRGVMTHLNATSAPIRYDNIATMASDIPIKTTLTVKGYVVCYFGVYDYAYSIDGGKTWIDISVGGAFYNKGTTDTTVIYKKNANGTYVLDEDGKQVIDESAELAAIKNKSASKYELLQFQWLTRNFANDGSYFATNNYGKFDTDQTALKIDLSAYTGQVVDVIVAAKPYRYGSNAEDQKNDIYLPITKVDNVAVYGNDGTFFSRVHSVLIDGRTNENLSGDTSVTPVPENTDHVGGGKLNFADKWNIGYTSAMNYTIFEPQNVNALNARYINDDLNIIKSGGRVTIDGYVICKGGVQRYKYSLDGGRTWTVINDTGTVIPEDKAAANGNLAIEMFKKCLVTDSSFDRTVDGANGAFCCTGLDGSYIKYTYTSSATAEDRKTFYNNALEFNIPALPDGAVRDLLVVAESTRGKLIPVLHIKLKIKYANGVSQYGYQSSTNRGELSTLSTGWQSELNQSLTFAPSVNSMNRITIPVTQSGEHQLVFAHMLSGSNITNGSKAEFFVVHDGGDYTYFSDVSRQFNSNAENVEHVYSVNYPDKGGLNRITANITVTDDDVKRGYIVLDANYTGITADSITVNLQLARDALTKKSSQTLIDTFFATKDKGYGNNVLMSTATKPGNHSFSYDPILNPPIRKGGINYDGSNTFSNASLSVSKTYFEVGEPITVDYNSTGLTNYGLIYITSAQECQPGKYGDLYIKCAEVGVNTQGTVKFTADNYNLPDADGTYNTTNVPWHENWDVKKPILDDLRELPAGEYKIWFVNNTRDFYVYKMLAHNWPVVTEPITIKVVDPEEPDLSMTYWSDRTYPNQTNNTTALTLNKVVYEQGEDIPFRISGKYEHVWVTVLKSDDFKGYTVDNLSSVSGFESYLNKNGTYARYAEWGSSAHANDLSGGVLKTVDGGVPLEPGQYKVVYLFGQCLQHAWQIKPFPNAHGGQNQKIMAIIDITIVPKNTLQKYSASYVRNDGSVGNIPLDIESPSVKDLLTTTTTLNGSTFTVNTTPTTKNITINVPNDVDISLKNNVAFNIQTVYGTYASSVTADSNTYKFNYSALANIEQNSDVFTYVTNKSGYYKNSYMSVPKTYFNVGESIPVTYTYDNTESVNDGKKA